MLLFELLTKGTPTDIPKELQNYLSFLEIFLFSRK